MALDVETIRQVVQSPQHKVDVLEQVVDEHLAALAELPERVCVPLREPVVIQDNVLESLKQRFKLSGWHLTVWYLNERKQKVSTIVLEPNR